MVRAAGLSIEQLVARGREPAPPDVRRRLAELAARRVRREPMAYILGEREFWGLPFKVSPAVLVPRPDSETVIEVVLGLMPDRGRPWRILDLGLGSGCLLLALLREYPAARGVGLDLSLDALAVAADNARSLAVADRADLRRGDWRVPDWQHQAGGPFDLVVANPPYIPAGAVADLMPEVRAHEPRLALDGGADGLDAYRRIAAAAPDLVSPGGLVVVEVGQGQDVEVAGFFRAAGLVVRGSWKDLGGIDRVVAAAWSGCQ